MGGQLPALMDVLGAGTLEGVGDDVATEKGSG
jgi:hypothetical protein